MKVVVVSNVFCYIKLKKTKYVQFFGQKVQTQDEVYYD